MRRLISLIALICSLLIPVAHIYAQESGEFLRLPLSPQASGMGDAFVALADDSLGLYYNPAGLASIRHPAASLVYHKYLQDINGNSFGFAYPYKSWALGIAPTFFKMKEEPIYDSLGTDTGLKFGYEAKIIPIALAGRIGNLAIGFAGKSYSENIGVQTSATTAYDVGAIYKLNKLSFGAAVQNLGGKVFDYNIAKIQRVGVAYTGSKYSAAADLKKEGEDKSTINLGGTYALADILRLRGGWRLQDAFGGITFGFGLELGSINFDYAYISYGDLGTTHKAGFSLLFGANADKHKILKNVEEPKHAEKTVINLLPELAWTGEEDYLSAGLSTGTNTAGSTFVYRVKYTDMEDAAPAIGYPKVHIKRNGLEVPGSPFQMKYVSGTNTAGAFYTHSITLDAGSDYSYFFDAINTAGKAAIGLPTKSVNGPAVVPALIVKTTSGTSIAVGDFIGKNASHDDASIVADFLRTELVNAHTFNVMDRNNMYAILAEQKLQNSGQTSQENAAAIGRLLNVKQMFVGSLSRLGNSYYIIVNVVDVETGKIIASYDSEAASSKDLRDACRRIVKKVIAN